VKQTREVLGFNIGGSRAGDTNLLHVNTWDNPGNNPQLHYSRRSGKMISSGEPCPRDIVSKYGFDVVLRLPVRRGCSAKAASVNGVFFLTGGNIPSRPTTTQRFLETNLAHSALVRSSALEADKLLCV
jgi:hypothetical protein